jgi:hypothetical protein
MKLSLLTELGHPRTGIYYWLPSPTLQWSVDPYFFEDHPNGINHQLAFRDYVAPRLLKIFNVPSNLLDFLADKAYGLPRGRVILNPDFKKQHKTGRFKFLHLHGNDHPGPLTAVLAAFNVSEQNAISTFDHHWQILTEDYVEICKILRIDFQIKVRKIGRNRLEKPIEEDLNNLQRSFKT